SEPDARRVVALARSTVAPAPSCDRLKVLQGGMTMSPSLRNGQADGRHPALHIDVLRGGQIIDEQQFDRRNISVGRAARNSLVLKDEQAPASLPLFHRMRH